MPSNTRRTETYSSSRHPYIMHDKSFTGARITLPSEFQQSQTTCQHPVHSLYKHHPCTLIHVSEEDIEYVSESSSNPESQKMNLSSKNLQLFLSRESSAGSSCEPSPVSDIFTQRNLSDDSISDISSMMDSCVLKDSYGSQSTSCEDGAGANVECEEQEAEDKDISAPTVCNVPTLAKVQAGLYTTVPLTPTSLQLYIHSHQSKPRPKPKPYVSPSHPQAAEYKSGWTRMQESTRMMEREAVGMRKDRNELTRWKGAKMAWM